MREAQVFFETNYPQLIEHEASILDTNDIQFILPMVLLRTVFSRALILEGVKDCIHTFNRMLTFKVKLSDHDISDNVLHELFCFIDQKKIR